MIINYLLIGAISMICITVSLFFLKFWRSTKDRFFLFFALSFLIEGVTRVFLSLKLYSTEEEPFYYITRLIAFMLIAFAVIDKNRKAQRPVKPD